MKEIDELLDAGTGGPLEALAQSAAKANGDPI
jgi:hypothetical protein